MKGLEEEVIKAVCMSDLQAFPSNGRQYELTAIDCKVTSLHPLRAQQPFI